MADLAAERRNPLSLFTESSDMMVAGGVIVIIMMMLIPLPTVLLDALMAVNLVVGLLIVLIVLYTSRALDFSVFPTILLVTTVYGLALNVSSTRLILSQGAAFDGRIVRSFATFVVGTAGTEGLVIGVIIFVILIAVQFLVITKGATRVAEVAARFTLDAMPQKQFGIEAEFNAGVITEEEMARKKEELQREAAFYGAMDGASKFVSGNVKVGILITFVNILGGIVVGVTIHGEPFELAANNYISLTIGDGLVSQFPALLISTATGLIVTRAISDSTFGRDVTKQFAAQGKVYWIAGAFLIMLSLLPGFPWYVLMPMAGLSLYLGYALQNRDRVKETAAREKEAAKKQPEKPQDFTSVAPLDPISLELGYGLVPLVDKDRGAELLERVTRIRREAALDLGVVIPRIRIIDNMRLEPPEYCLKLRGVEIGRGAIRLGSYLAINPGGASDDIPGEDTVDPAFQLPAKWITEENRSRAERSGYTVVDAPSIIATHLTELIKGHAADILDRQEVRSMLDNLKQDYPAVVEDVIAALSLGEIQKVLQSLLSEQVSIRNLVSIFESLADYGKVTKDPAFLTEKARQRLARQICLQYSEDHKYLRVITLDPQLEQMIIDSRVETAGGVQAGLDPDVYRKWIAAIMNTVRDVRGQGYFPIVLTSESARALVKSSTKRDIPDLVVLSNLEIIPEIQVEGIGEVRIDPARQTQGSMQ
ncbi:flagellar biosynthesis protein FlhA [Spirochaeta africana]|uniref:Flagellar biosynthesis protein FlhA n=1 Tax=Spirochaeta africana (strain ATCC 700263 / DSM 8902 / Z-7692) TaxID=889378 RepID=H9UKU0_SPIAZ|nr:flagellar biosynthesis protein FlhA [Spirochaeta africana]AFG38133.1 flagellar biosynthesis protein FlhA [Spirochaeta africana DSM 8902]